MIGGPAKREADFTFFGGVWEFPESFSPEEQLAHADRLERWLADDRYEFSARCRANVEAKIKYLRHFISPTRARLTHVEEFMEEMRQGKAEP